MAEITQSTCKNTERQRKFKSRHLVRIRKEKLKFDKGYELTFWTEILRVVTVVVRTPQSVYELSDLCGHQIEGQFYICELVKVEVSPETELKIDRIIALSRGRIIERPKLKGYESSRFSWVKPTDIVKLM
jgi:hypothetical protein